MENSFEAGAPAMGDGDALGRQGCLAHRLLFHKVERGEVAHLLTHARDHSQGLVRCQDKHIGRQPMETGVCETIEFNRRAAYCVAGDRRHPCQPRMLLHSHHLLCPQLYPFIMSHHSSGCSR
jgi:hypothetical protein